MALLSFCLLFSSAVCSSSASAAWEREYLAMTSSSNARRDSTEWSRCSALSSLDTWWYDFESFWSKVIREYI